MQINFARNNYEICEVFPKQLLVSGIDLFCKLINKQ